MSKKSLKEQNQTGWLQSTPPQSPSRSVKHQSLTQTLSQASTRTLSHTLSQNLSHSSENRKLWAQFGCTYIPQDKDLHPKLSPPANDGKGDLRCTVKGSVKSKMGPWMILRFILLIGALMIISAFAGAFGFLCLLESLIDNRNCSVSHSPSTEMLSLEKSTSTEAQMQQLMDSMNRLAEQFRDFQERLSHSQVQSDLDNSSKICSDVEINPQRGVHEELFGVEPDLACAGNLATVLATPDTSTLTVPTQLSLLGFHWLSISLQQPHGAPYTTIKGSIPEMGDCWRFLGQRGRLVLALHRPSHLTAVSLSQFPANLLPFKDADSAPRHFMVLAHRSEEDSENAMLLGEFEYTRTGPWRQSFSLNPLIEKEKLRIIEFRFLSNHGHPDHTCIYRVHIHGTMT